MNTRTGNHKIHNYNNYSSKLLLQPDSLYTLLTDNYINIKLITYYILKLNIQFNYNLMYCDTIIVKF